MKYASLIALLALTSLIGPLSAQVVPPVVGQFGMPVWTASGNRTQWVTPVNSQAFGLTELGTLTMLEIPDALPSMVGNGGKFLRVNAGATAYELATIGGGGDALVSGSLDQFADVTQTATKTLAITESTVLAGGTHSGTNTGDQTTVTGNAGTATALQTGRTINGTSFDGTANITITAAAGTLTGSTLASGVTASSLTSAAGGTFGTAAFTAATAYHPLTSTSTGGNGAADSGKLMSFNAWGGLELGSASNNLGTPGLVIKAGTANGLLIESSGVGAQAVDVQLNGSSGQAYSIHAAAEYAIGVLYDGSGDNATGTGARLSTNGAGLIVCNVDDNNKLGIKGGTGNIEWYGSATTPFTGTNKTILTPATPTGTNTITLPQETGNVVTTGGTGTVSATMLAETAVTPGTYTATNLTVDADGRITAASNGSGGATLGANTFTGQQVISVNAAASTPPLALTGTVFTGGSATTTKPQLLIEPSGTTSTAWSTAGTMLGVNAPSGFTGNLGRLQVAGVNKIILDYDGNIYVASGGGVTSTGTSLSLGTQSFSGGALITLFNFDVGFGTARTLFYDSNAYLSGGYQVQFANSRAGAADCGLKWGSTGTVKVTNGNTGYGNLSLNNLTLNTAALLSITSGSNQRAGDATLVGGTVTVNNTTVTANTRVFITRKTAGGTLGMALTYTVSAATSFTINSDNVLDTSTVSYFLVEVP